jgi:archaellum component FlaC
LSTSRNVPSERFFKKLIGKSDIEDALRRLDSLIQEEHRTAAAQDVRATHRVDERVMNIQHEVQGVDQRVQGVDQRTQGVDERVQGVGDRVKDVGDKTDFVIDGTHILFASSSCPLRIEKFCD